MIAIVDCNNFYASCERLFNPKLIDVPIVVLSNNDGCVIARSQEAKDLGIEMGAPAFQMEDFFRKHRVAVHSSNYTLYGDMSFRVMQVLGKFSPDVEVYSIDEAFLDLSNFVFTELAPYAAELRRTVKQYTGIPVGVGIAPTKTLAKAANRWAKKRLPKEGVFVMDSEAKRREVLEWMGVRDVWGIGHRNGWYWEERGVKTAWQLSECNLDDVRKKMGVVGVRLVRELLGEKCMDLELQPDPKKNICTSRSFPTDLTDYKEIAEAVGTHTTRCAEKLRRQGSCAGMIQVFLATNRFLPGLAYEGAALPYELKVPTNSTRELLHYSMAILKHIFRPDRKYKKAGVIVCEIVPQGQVQGGLFDKVERGPASRDNRLMAAMDSINKMGGQDTIRFGAAGYSRTWRLRCEHKTPAYTTNFKELLKVHI